MLKKWVRGIIQEELEKMVDPDFSEEGDGEAAVLSDMTAEEYEDYKHNVERGWGNFYGKIKQSLGYGKDRETTKEG